ncbi:hypothetical protein B566_EDAN011475 [Ephemera danica]|nr:hypothetical protein B566_EDAN011475 [Ephemera danica]
MWIIHFTLILCCSLQVFANENNKYEPQQSTDETYDEGKLEELQNKTTDDADGTTNLTEMSRLDEELAVARKKIEQLNNKVDALKQQKSLLKRITARENELKLSLTQQEQERAKQLEKIETLTLELEQAQEALVMEREKFLQQHDTFTQLVENLESKHALCESSKSNATSILETEQEKIVEKHQEALKQLQICEELRRVTTTLPPTTATPATTCRYIICKTPSCLNANTTKAAALSSPRNVANFAVFTSLNRAGSRCNYAWENGASLTYTNWRPGDPWHQATEECMILTANSWADVPCDRKYRFLCEQVP